ncbi:ABC transporter ATP-binding protein [Leptospira bouyouniensis]|uniref:ABC transporter ATP-binding protein n=1 Tax=Leptospira bouyouniensis TaxID=2484911 RepID=A0ABY2LA69_9LEPT|nr:ABC transporter ATP-binding protein [Leptospira bouyouniensis]TGK52539.1 ABC transporter ATP-binding protein [Leptospira bouyouniensis]
MNVGILAENIIKSFGEPAQVVLQDVSLSIKEGDFVALTGKSGSGKSTLLYIVSGLDFPSSGDVKLSGKSLQQMDSKELHALRNHSIGFVFQFHYLLPELTGLENITMPARKTGNHKQVEEYALHLMESFSVSHCKDKFPSQMSGGEGQRVAIARALVQKPKFLFADEPTGNLDTANGDKVMEIFKRINSEDGTTILFVTHDPDYAATAHQRIHMIDGKIAEIS